MDITLTEAAANKAKQFLADDESITDPEAVALRIQIQAGGCAGFRYVLYFDDRDIDGDVVEVQHGVTLRVDKASRHYLEGAVVDWKESLEESGFAIDNPNASGSCACGESASY